MLQKFIQYYIFQSTTEMLSFYRENLRVLIGFLSSDVGAIHLLSQNPDYTNEKGKVHLARE